MAGRPKRRAKLLAGASSGQTAEAAWAEYHAHINSPAELAKQAAYEHMLKTDKGYLALGKAYKLVCQVSDAFEGLERLLKEEMNPEAREILMGAIDSDIFDDFKGKKLTREDRYRIVRYVALFWPEYLRDTIDNYRSDEFDD
jgi:hypothetical protein